MKHLLAKATIALALGATALSAAPADAQRYRGGYRGHDRAGTALVAGVAGLAIGAALASDRRPYYYDRYDGYYDGPEVVYEDYPQPYYYGYPYRGYAYRGYAYRGGYGGYQGGYGGYRGGGYRGGGGHHGGGHHR